MPPERNMFLANGSPPIRKPVLSRHFGYLFGHAALFKLANPSLPAIHDADSVLCKVKVGEF